MKVVMPAVVDDDEEGKKAVNNVEFVAPRDLEKERDIRRLLQVRKVARLVLLECFPRARENFTF